MVNARWHFVYGKSHLVINVSYQTFHFKNEFSRVNRFDSVRNSAIHPTKISGDSVVPYRSFGGLVRSKLISYRFHLNIPASVPNIAEISPKRSLEKNLTVSVNRTKTLGLLMAISSFAWIFAGLQSTVKNFAAREQKTNWYLCQLNGCDFTNRRLRRTGSGANNITVRSHVS